MKLIETKIHNMQINFTKKITACLLLGSLYSLSVNAICPEYAAYIGTGIGIICASIRTWIQFNYFERWNLSDEQYTEYVLTHHLPSKEHREYILNETFKNEKLLWTQYIQRNSIDITDQGAKSFLAMTEKIKNGSKERAVSETKSLHASQSVIYLIARLYQGSFAGFTLAYMGAKLYNRLYGIKNQEALATENSATAEQTKHCPDIASF